MPKPEQPVTQPRQPVTQPKQPVTQLKRLARTAGAAYVLMGIFGVFAHLIVRSSVHVPGDAAATAANIAEKPSLFRLALVADIAMATTFVAVGVLLFLALRHFQRHVAMLMVVFVAIGAGMTLINLLFHQAALWVATDATYAAFSSDELVLFLVDLHHHGYTLAGIFFGLWLIPLGYLTYRAGLFPQALSVLLMVAGGSWILDTLAAFAFPDVPTLRTILEVPRFAEFWLILYLIIKGVREPEARRPEQQGERLQPDG